MIAESRRLHCVKIPCEDEHQAIEFCCKDAPYGPTDRAKILGCLNEAEAGEERVSQSEGRDKSWADGDKAMIASLKRTLARDFTEDDPPRGDQELRWLNDRESSMYLNFQWLYSRLGKHSKMIVWAATVHTAKTLSGVNGFEGRVPFGSYIRHDFGDRAFSLGFSAYSGDYEFLRPPVRQLSAAPASSLEGQVFAHGNSDAVFVSRKQLRKYGSVAARPLGTDFKTMGPDSGRLDRDSQRTRSRLAQSLIGRPKRRP